QEPAVDDGAEVEVRDDSARHGRLLENRQQGARRLRTQTGELIGRRTATRRRREGRRRRSAFRRRRLARRAAAALADRAAEELLAAGRRHLQARVLRARRLPEDRDQLRIAAERDDVRAHPLECGTLIEQSLVAGVAMARVLARERRVGKEPE